MTFVLEDPRIPYKTLWVIKGDLLPLFTLFTKGQGQSVHIGNIGGGPRGTTGCPPPPYPPTFLLPALPYGAQMQEDWCCSVWQLPPSREAAGREVSSCTTQQSVMGIGLKASCHFLLVGRGGAKLLKLQLNCALQRDERLLVGPACRLYGHTLISPRQPGESGCGLDLNSDQ